MELICIFPLACALYIWHDTDTFVEYMSLFGLGNFFGIKKFKEERELNPMMDYESYLLINHNSFSYCARSSFKISQYITHWLQS